MVRRVNEELRSFFCSRVFWVALAIGMTISITDVCQNFLIVDAFEQLAISSGFGGYSLFIRWMAINGDTYGSMIFLYIWPVIATLPFAWLYCVERTKNNTRVDINRSGLKYRVSIYISTFISGGIVIFTTLLSNLLLNALVCPMALPTVTSMLTPILNRSFLPNLYYTYPWLYAYIWCLVSFLFGGSAACICLTLTTHVKNAVLLILTPFLILISFDMTTSYISRVFSIDYEISPLRLIYPATYNYNPTWLVFSILCIILISTFLLYCFFSNKGLERSNND